MVIRIELPLEAIEPIFNSLNTIKPSSCGRVEYKALGLLKTIIYFELEKIMETEEEKYERDINFKQLFREERKRRLQEQHSDEKEELMYENK